MTELTDLIIPYSALQLAEDGHSWLLSETGIDTVQTSALLQKVIEREAEKTLESGDLYTVSATFDVSASASGHAVITFESRIDRKTRTLVFASGLALQDKKPLVRATMVYRIA